MFLWQFVRLSLILAFVQGSSGWAATYWVASSGSDANSCASVSGENDTGRYRTVNGGLSCLSAGDTLMVKNGIYNYSFPNDSIPSGSSPSAKTCIIGESQAGVIFRPDANKAGWILGFTGSRSNLCFRSITLDGVNQGTTGSKAGIAQGGTEATKHNWEITDVTVKNFGRNKTDSSSRSAGNGIILDSMGTGHLLRRLHIENNGKDTFGSGIYWRAKNSIIEYSTIINNSNDGLHFNSTGDVAMDNNIIRYNVVMNNGVRDINLNDGSNHLAHNNLVGGSRRPFEVNKDGQRIYNNTVYGATLNCIRLQSGTSNHIVQNNIFLNCGGSPINDLSTGSKTTPNLTSGRASDVFMDPAAGNFRLKAGSPAIDAGVAISGLTSDLDATSVPTGCCYDMGAYEYSDAVFNIPPPPSNLQVRAE